VIRYSCSVALGRRDGLLDEAGRDVLDMDKIKVIFDTDPGIDDAMALLFLHYAPNRRTIIRGHAFREDRKQS
jgi:hypothetical protein